MSSDSLTLEGPPPALASANPSDELHWTLKRRPQRTAALPTRRIRPDSAATHRALPVPPSSAAVQVQVTAESPGSANSASALCSHWVGWLQFELETELPVVVRKGQKLAAIKALALEWPLVSPADGVVRELLACEGEPVEYGQPLIDFQPTA